MDNIKVARVAELKAKVQPLTVEEKAELAKLVAEAKAEEKLEEDK